MRFLTTPHSHLDRGPGVLPWESSAEVYATHAQSLGEKVAWWLCRAPKRLAYPDAEHRPTYLATSEDLAHYAPRTVDAETLAARAAREAWCWARYALRFEEDSV